MTYHSGEEIHQGDFVMYGGNAGTIELVVDGAATPETEWHLQNSGAGVMVVEPRVFGRVYVQAPHDDEALVFVSRAKEGSS